MDTCRGKRLTHHLWKVGEEPGADRLHHSQSHTVSRSILRTEHTRLIFVIKVVVLDKAKIPRRCIFDYPFEQLQAIVEGEAHKAYFPLRLQIFHLLDKSIRQYIVFPRPMHNHVNVIEVYYICADRTARLVEKFLKVIRTLHLPPRHFGGYIYTVTPASCECFTYRLLALTAHIDTSCIDVIHAALNGTAYHRRSLFEIHMSVLHRQTQHSKPQCRHIHPRPSHRSVSHLWIIIKNIL